MDFVDDDEDVPTLVEVDSVVSKRIPVSILTGFLGSGKTTLLNYLLRHNHGKRIAIIENEFSSGLGIDFSACMRLTAADNTVTSGIENMIAKSGVDGEDIAGFFELSNGCICCSVKDDLLATLEQLVLHKDRFDYVLIETTGVANPGPIISSLWADEEAESALQLDGVVTVVDSVNILKYLADKDTSSDVKMQLAFADRILLNKSDLLSQDQMNVVESAVRGVNSSAEVRQTCYANVSPDWVLDARSYTTADVSSVIAGANCCGHSHDHSHGDHDHSHKDQSDVAHLASSLSTHGFSFPGQLDLGMLKVLLDGLLYSFSDADGETGGHAASGAISNSSTSEPKCRIFRMKGVFHVKGDNHLHILQAVHDVFDIQASSFCIGSENDTTGGENKVIVIGKDIDNAFLESEFKKCLK